jgi:hypothetical protein
MLKAYNKIDELDKDTLASDPEFLEDASLFLREREGLSPTASPEEVYDAFMEHMRYQDVNEITALRDLEYAQNANLEGKQRFGRLIDAYDKVNEDVSGRMMWDYAAGVLTAPSTYIGLVSGGTGKVASMAGTQAAKLGVRKILSEGLKSAGKAAIVEGAIGAGQGAIQEEARVETGLQEEIRGERVAMTGLASAAGAGLINFPIGMYTARKASKANELLESSKIATAKKANEASEKSAEVLAEAGEEKVASVKSVLNALDPTKVAEGRRLKKDLMPGDTMEAALGAEVVDNIAAAAIRVSDKLELKEGDRITTAIHRLIDSNNEGILSDVNKILEDHNLTYDQFSLVYLAEISDAGRTLGSQARVSKALGRTRTVRTPEEKLIDELDELHKAGVSPVTAADAKDLGKARQTFQDLDKLRLGLMTSQLATTMRNNLNGGMRIAVDATTRAFDNMFNLRNPFDGTFDVAKYVLNPYEGKIIRQLFAENFPEESAKLFREAADLSARTSGETWLATAGRKVNFLNTASDNMFKQAMISASLKRRLSDAGIDMYDVIAKGDFGKIDNDILEKAIADSYEFTYQSSMKGDDWFSKGARGVLKAHQEVPFVVSAFMPFPRFVANQLKFVYEHAPLIGMLPLDRLGSRLPARTTKEYLQQKLPKQMTGAMMLTSAYAWRVQQGDTNYWYEIDDGQGNVIDGRAVYGPFAPFMLAADLIYRYQRGTMPTSIHNYVRDTTQALLGSTFRAGVGLYAIDKLYQDAASGKGQKIIAETLGNIANTFTLPLAVIKDFQGQFDPEARKIPETRSGESDNFLDIIYKRATRSLPENPLNGYDTAALSPFETGDLSAVNPMEKQIFGFGKRKKNVLTKELAKLNFTPYDLYKREQNDKYDLYTRQELSRDEGEFNLEQKMSKLILSDEYDRLSNEEKRDILKKAAGEVISGAKEIARNRMEREADIRDLPYSELDEYTFGKASSILQGRINSEYRRLHGGTTTVTEDKDKTVIINGKEVNVMRWAASRASELSGKGGKL